jgi:hypothetical protein
MSGKDLLAVLAMIVPSLTLIAAIAFAVGVSGTEKVREGQNAGHDAGLDAAKRAKAQTATQKLMREPWEKPVYAKTSSAPQCDPEKVKRDGRCLYW